MAPTIPDWLCCSTASTRRNRELTQFERTDVQRRYGPGTGTAAIYDPETDSLVLPTGEVSPDPLHPVLHELGHAVTLDRVWVAFRRYISVLDDLPSRIRDHLARGYPDGDDVEAIRIRIAEAIAEAYAMMLGGRHHELPPTLTSALIGNPC
jgi:hypothetical protein